MVQRTDFSLLTNLGNVADPALPQDAATRNYVDTRPSGGTISFEVPGVYTLATTGGNAIRTSLAQPAGVATNIFVTAGAGNATAAGLYINGFGTSQIWKFVGSNTTFTISSVAISGDNVILNFATSVNFATALTAGTQLESQVSAQSLTTFTRLIAGTGITGAVAPDADNVAALTLNSTGGGGGLASVVLNETNWRTVTTSTLNSIQTINITDNPQRFSLVFAGAFATAVQSESTSGSASPVASNGATIEISANTTSQTLPAFTPGTFTVSGSFPSLDLQDIVAREDFKTQFFGATNRLWTFTVDPSGIMGFRYAGKDNVLAGNTDPNPSLVVMFGGTWTTLDVLTYGFNIAVDPSGTPSFRTLRSTDLYPAVNGSPTNGQVPTFDALSGNLIWGTGGGVNISSPNATLTVGGSPSAPLLDVAIPAETLRIDGRIATNIGSATTRIQMSNGGSSDAVIISQVAGQPVLMSVATATQSGPIVTNLNNLGAFNVAAAAQGPAADTLVVANYLALAFQIQCTFPATTTLAQVQSRFGGLRSDGIWVGTATQGTFTFQPPPRTEILRLAATVSGTPGGANTQIQFNNNGVFAGSPNLTWLGVNGLQLGTLASPAPLVVGNAATPTALTPGTAGQVLTSAGAAKTPYWSSGGAGGSTTLQGLTDVAITEPVFVQVGTITVVSISAGTTSITVTSSAGILVGNWLRGGVVMPGQLPALQVISIAGNLLEFNLDPTPFFVVGDFVYRLPATLEGARLSFSNAQNKWISSESLNFLPMDTISWVSLAGDPYVSAPGSPIVVAPITTNVLDLVNPWTFGIATLGDFPSPSEVCGVDALGRQVTGQYVSAAQAGTPTAILEFIKADRVSGGGFVINNTYPLTWRRGTFALPDYVRFNTTSNAITQGQAAVDLRTATLIGVNNTPTSGNYVNGNVGSVTLGFGNGGTTWQALSTLAGYTAAVTALTATGATPPATLPGNWTLPAYPIYISNLANPTATQFGTISAIQASPASNVFVVTFTGNQPYFGNVGPGSQPLFTSIGKFTFVPAPQAEIVRLAGTTGVTSLQTLRGDINLASPNGTIGITTSGQNINLQAAGGSAGATNSTTFITQGADAAIGMVGAVGFASTNAAVQNAACVGFGMLSDQDTLDGGFIGATKYLGTTQTMVNPYGWAALFPVATTYADLQIEIFSPSYTFAFTTQNSAAAGDFMLDAALFSRADSTAASPPDKNANLFPGFAGNGSDDIQLIASMPAALTITGSGTNWSASVSAGAYTGIVNNYAHLLANTTVPYIAWLRVLPGTGNNITSVTNIVINTVSPGAYKGYVSLSGTAGATPSWNQTMLIGNTSTLPAVFQDSSTPAKSVSLGAPTTVSTSYALKLPGTQSTSGQTLLNDGAGALRWGFPTPPTVERSIFKTNSATTSGTIQITGIATLAEVEYIFTVGETFTITPLLTTTSTPLFLTVATGAITSPSANVFNIPIEPTTATWTTGRFIFYIQVNKSYLGFNQPFAYDIYSGFIELTFDTTLTTTIEGSVNLGPLRIARQDATDGQVLTWNSAGLTWLPANSSGGASTTRQIQAISTVNVTPTGAQTVDGYVVVTGDTILLTSQTDATTQGLYTASTTGAWTKITTIVFQSVFSLFGTTNGLKQYSRTAATPNEVWILTAISSGGGSQNLQQVLNFGNSATNTGTNVSTLSLTDSVSGRITTLDGTQVRVGTSVANNTNSLALSGAATLLTPSITAAGVDTDVGIKLQTKGAGTIQLASATGVASIALSATATTISSTAGINLSTDGPINIGYAATGRNYYKFENAEEGFSPSITVVGPDNNIGFFMIPKGAGELTFGNFVAYTGITLTSEVTTVAELRAIYPSSLAPGPIDFRLTPYATGSSIFAGSDQAGLRVVGGSTTATELQSFGTPVNLNLALTPKGTGDLFPIGPGPLSATVANQPTINVATAAGALTLGSGTAGQSIISNANNGSPYWGYSTTPTIEISIFSTTTNTTSGTIQITGISTLADVQRAFAAGTPFTIDSLVDSFNLPRFFTVATGTITSPSANVFNIPIEPTTILWGIGSFIYYMQLNKNWIGFFPPLGYDIFSGFIQLSFDETLTETIEGRDGLGPLRIARQNATDGQVLTWNTAALTWRPATPAGGASTTRQIAAISTVNVTASGAQTVDGYVVVTGDYILLTNQTDATTQGLYIASTTGAWAKQTTITFQSVFSLNGTANGLKQYSRTSATPNEVWILTATTAASQNLQQVLNTGNSATNTGTNISTLLLTDSVSAKTTTIDGTKVEAQSLILDGSTQGTATLKAAANTTTSYQLTLPAVQGQNGRGLVNDGAGNLTWQFVLGTRQIKVISLVNVTPTGAQTVDGVVLVNNDTVLLQNQTDPATNGLYQVNVTNPWTRVTTFIFEGVFATVGTLNMGKTYSRTSDGAVPGNEIWIITAINAATGSGTPGGLTTQFQYNNSGVFAGAAALTFDATNGRVSTLAPVVAANLARLADVQASAAGLRPQNTAGIALHIAEVNLSGTYTNNSGVGSATFSGATQLVVAGVTPAVGSEVLLANQSSQLQNGSYFVTTSASNAFVLTRTSVVPAYGNFFVATNQLSNNWGVQYQNVTTGTITVGLTAIIYAQFGVPNAAIPSLQAVCNVGATTTTSVSVGGNFQVGYTAAENSNLILLTGSGVGGIPTISTTGVDTNIGLRLTTKGASPIYIADEIRIGDSVTDYLSVVQGSISRSTAGDLAIGNVGAFTGIAITGGQSIYSTLQAVGLGTNISVSLQPKGAGNVFPIGSALSASIQPKLAVADGIGSNTLGTGTAGQVLTSGGSTSPYWGFSSNTRQINLIATVNITPSGNQTVDGVSILNGSVVLLPVQTDATTTGLYTASTTGAWARITTNTLQSVYALSGTVNIGRTFSRTISAPNETWIFTASKSIPGGTDTQFQFNSSGQFAGTAALTYDATNVRVNVAAPLVASNAARLADVQAATAGLRPQNTTGTPLHIAEVNVVGTYSNNSGIGSAVFSGTNLLTIAGVLPAVNDEVLLANQTAGLQNGSYFVTDNSLGTFLLTRTNIVPTYGNFFVSTVNAASNYGVQYQNVTTGTITVGITAIIYAQFGVPNAVPGATPTLQAVTAAGANTQVGVGLQDSGTNAILLKAVPTLTASRTYQLNISNYPVISNTPLVSDTAGVIAFGSILNVGNNLSDYLNLSSSIIGRVGAGSLTINAGNVAGNQIILGNSAPGIINRVGISSGATLVGPTITVAGTDANAPLNIAGAGTGVLNLGTNRDNYIRISGANTGVNPSITAFGDVNTSLNINASGTGSVSIANAGANSIRFSPAATGVSPQIIAVGDTNAILTISSSGSGAINLGNSGANFIRVVGAVAGVLPVIAVSGEANAGLQIQTAGTGTLRLNSATVDIGTNAADVVRIVSTQITKTGAGNLYVLSGTASGASLILGNSAASTGNYVAIASSGINLPPTIFPFGDATQSLNVNGAGTGSLNLCANFTNFVRITGGTGASGIPTISGASNSSINADLRIDALGTGAITLGRNNTNYIRITPSSGAPTIAAAGSAELSLSITPAGSGQVVIGNIITYTGLTVQGASTTATSLAAAGAGANLDIVLVPKGSGNLYPIGSALPLVGQPKIAVAASVGATSLGFGTAGQVMTSNGISSAPYWGAVSRPAADAGFSAGGLGLNANFQVVGGVETVVNWSTGTANPPTGWTYASGVFTNNTGLPKVVAISAAVQVTGGTANLFEQDLWIAQNPNNRLAQAVNTATYTTGNVPPLNVSTIAVVANGGTLRVFFWASTTVSLAAGGAGYGFGGARCNFAVIA